MRHSVPKPSALVLNYPSNPTAEVVDLNFYSAIVDFCREHGIYIISDLAYAEVYFEGPPPPSILQVPGAKEIAVEFTSLSKTYDRKSGVSGKMGSGRVESGGGRILKKQTNTRTETN